MFICFCVSASKFCVFQLRLGLEMVFGSVDMNDSQEKAGGIVRCLQSISVRSTSKGY
jgi:hypothetical protein